MTLALRIDQTACRQLGMIFDNALSLLRSRTDDRPEVEAIPIGSKMISLSLAANLTEARKFFRDDEMRSGTPGPDVVRVRMPSVSRAWGSISIAVVNRNADVAQDHHGSSGSKWRCDEGDHCSREQGYRPVQRTGVDARTTDRPCARSALGRIRTSASSPRGAGMVRTNRRGAPSETLLSLQEIVA
jgi:hypothetical protein